MIKLHMCGLPVKEKEYRDGSSWPFIDNDKNCIVIDGGESTLLTKTINYVRGQGVTKETHILTHWHPDHDRGLRGFLEASGIRVEDIYCPPVEEIKALDYSDYSRGSNILSLAENLGKTIKNPPAGKWTDIQVGSIKAKIWRRKGTLSDKASFRVNNTSMIIYFPELYTLVTGDTIIIDEIMPLVPGPVRLILGLHHGNACATQASKVVKRYGVLYYIYDDIEPGGTIGKTEFTSTGAKCTKAARITTLCTTSDVNVIYAAGKATIYQGSNKWSFDIPYQGTVKEGWILGSKGWWYQYKDGTWAVGWKVLPWSGGKNWFYFDASGWMKTGWIKDTGWWYYLDPATGAMQTGWLQYHGKRCYLEPVAGKNQGHAYMSQTAVIDGKTYSFDADCYATEITTADPVTTSGKTRLNVIDIASYQSGLDLTKANAGLDGVIIKATQGTTYVNPYCNKHYAQAKQAGLLRGLYHYASGVGAEVEADAFVRNIKGYIGDCILALDWEGQQNSQFGKNDVAYCKKFLDRVYAITGVRPLIYMSKSVCRAHDWSSVAKDYGLWCAQYGSNNATGFQESPWTDSNGFGAWPYPAIYQYSSNGVLQGYSGRLDLDLAYMTPEAWGKYAKVKE